MPRSSSVTTWNRLEPEVQSPDFIDNLQARVADPMWMLGRQWQIGEFQGEDAGSLVDTKLLVTISPLVKFRARGDSASPIGVPYHPPTQPLEALVERERVRTRNGGSASELRTAAEAGAHFLRLLKDQGLASYDSYRQRFIDVYPLPAAPAGADPASLRFARLTAGKLPDGFALEAALRPLAGQPSVPFPAALAPGFGADEGAVRAAVDAWIAWWDALMSEADADESAWLRERLEHRFDVGVRLYDGSGAAEGEVVLAADEYPGGRLDWSSFDLRVTPAGAPAAPIPSAASDDSWAERTISYEGLPAPIEIPGMPLPRYWEMEEGRVDLSRIEPAADDLGRMLLMEFVLVYSNDWQLIPLEVPVGTVLRVASLEVTDTFGTKLDVRPSYAVDDSNDVWGMYQLSPRTELGTTVLANAEQAPLFLLPPVLGQFQQSEPIEEVHFLRDEMANLAWGVERTVPSLLGTGRDRLEEEKQRIRAQLGTGWPDLSFSDPARYVLGTRVPAFWIPLLPAPSVPGGDKNRLLGGRMLDPETREPVQPAGTLLQNNFRAPPLVPLSASNETEVTTTSTAYVNTNCQTGALRAGVDYLVIYGAACANDSASGFCDIRLMLGDTTVAEAGMESAGLSQPSAGQKQQGFLRVTGDGTATLRLQFRNRSGTTARIDAQYIIALPLDGLVEGKDYFHTGTSSAADEIAAQDGAWATLRSTSALGPIPDGQYLVLMSCEARFAEPGSASSGCRVRARVNGAALFPTAETDDGWLVEWEDNTDVFCWAACGIENVAGGDNSFAIEVRSRDAVNTAYRRSNIWLIRTASFDQIVQTRATTGASTILGFPGTEFVPLRTAYTPNQPETVVVLSMAQTGQSSDAYTAPQELVLGSGATRASRSGQGFRDATATGDNWPITMAAVESLGTEAPQTYRVNFGELGAGTAYINRKRDKTNGPQANLVVWSLTRPRHALVLPSMSGLIEEPFRIWDEEVPRAGAHLTRRYEYARWNDGSSHLWVARRKRPGLGEGASRLSFDGLEDGKQTLSSGALANLNKTPISAIRAFNEATPVTSSTSYVDSGCETAALLPGVGYLVVYGASTSNDSDSGFCDMRLVHGSDVLSEAGMESSAENQPGSGQKQQGFLRVTGDGTRTLKLQFKNRSGSNARAGGQYIIAIPLDQLQEGVDYFQVGSSAASDERTGQGSATWGTLRDTAALGGIPDGRYLVLMSCEGRFTGSGSAADGCMVRARANGGALFPTGEVDECWQVEWEDNTDVFCWAVCGVQELSNGGANQLAIEVKSRGATQTAWRRSNIWLFDAARFDQIVERRATTGDSTTTTYPGKEFAALQTEYTPNQPEDVVVLTMAQPGQSADPNLTQQAIELRPGTLRATRSGQGFRNVSATGDNWPVTMATVDSFVPRVQQTYRVMFGRLGSGTSYINRKRNHTDGSVATLIAWSMTLKPRT